MCVRISLPLAGIAVGLSVTAFARIKIRSRQADEYSQKNEHIKGRLESCRYSAVYDMECAVINGVQDQVLDAYRKQREEYWQEKLRDVRREGLTNAVMETLGHGFRCAAPAALLGGGAVTYSAATSALSVLDSLTESIHSLSLDTEGIVKAFAPIERLTDLLMSGAQGQDQADGMNIHKPAIRVDRLSVSFAGRPCLRSVTMEIPFGQKVALIGKNGSGKSTLLRAILGTIKPEEGCVQINHANALLLSHDAKRAIFSYAPASAQMFSENVSDNIAMGADASETVRVSDAAKTASIEEALLSARGDALSGGQAQRINLARAFVHASPILILDEPTSSISAGQGEEIIRKALASPTTALVTTHDPASLALFDRVVLLENGAVAFDGNCEELIKTRQYREWKGELDESLKGEKENADS